MADPADGLDLLRAVNDGKKTPSLAARPCTGQVAGEIANTPHGARASHRGSASPVADMGRHRGSFGNRPSMSRTDGCIRPALTMTWMTCRAGPSCTEEHRRVSRAALSGKHFWPLSVTAWTVRTLPALNARE